jgi:hypothetical protein
MARFCVPDRLFEDALGPDHRAFETRKPDIALAGGGGRQGRRVEDGLDGPVWSGIGRGTRTLRGQRSAPETGASMMPSTVDE